MTDEDEKENGPSLRYAWLVLRRRGWWARSDGSASFESYSFLAARVIHFLD
ncbi:hypothetical protein CCACVL1_02575 [Corchorus capsularis]|uniref:Uncharacterized protein n=1 Tax=Corchorus capsularis TaxID=210143 RepID=A0A1R3K7J3_COCAP|nr:hypothetical protein CCACVL1_02575 [Corchorus capsularis]